MIEDRGYQNECINTVWKNMQSKQDQLVVLPTASGKTIIFTMLLDKIMKVYPQLKSLILVNKVNLIEQTKGKLIQKLKAEDISLFCGSLGDYDQEGSVVVGSVQSISKTTSFFNLLIIDECHNADNSPTYTTYIEKLILANPKLKIVRFTATPFTINGYIYGEDKPNKIIDFKRTMNEMIKAGYIVKPVFKGSDKAFDVSLLPSKRGEFIMRQVEKMSLDEKKVRDQVPDALSKLDGRNKIVWSCTCIAHAELVHSVLIEYEPASIIHSKLNKSERFSNIESFENSNVRHVVSIMMVSEGYDFPPIDGIVGMRPTRSPVLYVQLTGRGLRLFPGKKDCLFLDYGGIVEELGHPNDPLVIKKAKNKAEKKAIICPACMEFNFLPIKKCTDCGYVFYKEQIKAKRHTKKLDRIAAEMNFNENSKIEFDLGVLDIKINERYTTKKGKLCWLVDYITMRGAIKEYLLIGSKYHKEFKRDFNLMGKPKMITVEKTGRFLSVKEKKWK